MITQKRINIPIYNYRLTIIIFDEYEELVGLIPKNTYDHCYDARGLTTSNGYAGIVCVDSQCESTIIHECEHVKNYIWECIGYTPNAENDEVDAYLLTYLYEKVVEVFCKHNKN